MANVLGKALKTDLNKPPAISAGEDYMKSVEPTLKELKGAEEQKLKFEKEKSIQTAESEAEKAKSFSSAKEGEIKSLREDPARAELEGLMGQKAKAEFIPTQENAKDMATLFSLMNVIGFAIGAGGKQHAQQAMSAMNGMLEGHQKGRDDLYRQERNIFDINQKLLDKKIDGLFKFMQENSKLYTKDKELAEQNAMVKFAEEGAGFLKAYYEKNGPGPTFEYMKQLVKAKEHAADLTDKEKTRAENERFRLQQAAIAAQAKKDAAAGRTPAGAKGNVAGAVERMTQSMGQASDALTNLARLPVTTSNPIFGQSSFNSLFTAPLSVLNQKMSDDTSQMMKTRMAAVSRTLASLETGGAATGLVGLTKSIEDGVAIPAGSSLVVALDKLAEMRRIVETSSRIAFSSSNYSSSQKDEIQKSLNLVRTAIPYSQEDLDLAIRTSQGKGIKLQPGEKNMTFTEFVNEHGLGEKPSASTEKKQMPTGEKLSSYTQAHPEFNGDEEKAKEFLRSQGYK